MAPHVLDRAVRIPLVLLQDRRLDEADLDPAAFGPALAQEPFAVDPHARSHGRGQEPDGPARTRALLERDGGERRGNAGDEERHPVDRGVARDLDEPRKRLLAVTEKAPREVAQGVRAQDLARHPGQGRQQQRPRAEGTDPRRDEEAEERREESEGQAQHHHHGDPQPQVEAAVLDDHRRRPVDEPERGHGSRDVPEPEAVGRTGGAGEGDQQRGQRHPGHRPMAETGKGQDDEQAREEGQRLRAEPNQCAAGIVVKTSSALKEDRTKTPEYTVGKPSARARRSKAPKPSGLT